MSSGDFFEKIGTAIGASAAPGGYPARPLEPMVPQHLGAGFKRWGGLDGTAFYGIAESHNELPAGLYRCAVSHDRGPILLKQRVETDALMELPDDAGASIIAEFKQFWDIAATFRERGFLHKRGFLLYGPPGSGKTSTLQLLIKRLISEQQGIVLLIDRPDFAAACLQLVRGIEPNRPMIVVLEDIDALVQRFGEHEFLALLDGEAQVDNVVYVGTTNYPERLDRRFVDRPGRFDVIRFIDMPSAAARRLYLEAKAPSLDANVLDLWVAASDGFSVAHLREMLIAVKCFGQPLEEVVARLREMQESKPTSAHASGRPAFGFGRQIASRPANGAAA